VTARSTVDVTGVVAASAGEVIGAAARPTVEVTGAAALLAAEVTGVVARLTVEVTGAAAPVALDDACETPAEAWLTGVLAFEVTGVVTLATTLPTALLTAPTRPPEEPGDDDAGVAGAARLVVAACALDPETSQKTAIKPRQQPASTSPRNAIRLASFWPADSHVSGTAYSTPV
jgi:hypothetical protein